MLFLDGGHLLFERVDLVFEFLDARVAGLGGRLGGGKEKGGSGHESPRTCISGIHSM